MMITQSTSALTKRCSFMPGSVQKIRISLILMRRLSLMLGSVLKYGRLTGAHDVYKYYYFGALHFFAVF